MSNGQHYDWAKLIRQTGGKIDSRYQSRRRAASPSHATQGPDLAHEPFECPSCGDRFPVTEPCPRCVLTPFDTRTGVRVEERVRVPAHGLGVLSRIRSSVAGVAHRLAEGKAERAAARGPRVGRAGGVRGTIHVLRPVQAPDGQEPCGAYRRVREVAEPCGCRPECRRRTLLVREESAVGLLALVTDDETLLVGVPRSVTLLGSARRSGDLFLRDGEAVAAVGLRERRVVDLPRTAGYREPPPDGVRCLVGTASAPCWLLV